MSVLPVFSKFLEKVVYIEDITQWREDMNFIFERVSKILFLPRENKIHIFKPPCNVLSGAIIGDGDRKRAPFLVLGLAQ